MCGCGVGIHSSSRSNGAWGGRRWLFRSSAAATGGCFHRLSARC